MIWFVVVILIVLLDQLTKWLVINNIGFGEKIILIKNFFCLTYIENKGAAWGILQNKRFFFIIMTAIISAVTIYFLIKSHNTLLKLSLSFIIAGGIGNNLIDRVFRGSVIDFLDFYIFGYDFPKFNVADTFIVIGTGILSFYLLFFYKEPDTK